MPLSIPELTRIAEVVAAEHDAALRIVGVASSDSDTGRVELLVTVSGCHEEPCTLLINLPRHERTRFEAELRSHLRNALHAHKKPGDADSPG